MAQSKVKFTIEVREAAFERADYHCECKCEKCLGNQQINVHHGVSNSKMNRKVYGNEKVQSLDNAHVLCQYCHDNCKHKFRGFLPR